MILVGSWLGAGHQKDQAIIQSLEFSAPIPILREDREDIDHACMMEAMQSQWHGLGNF